MAGLLLLGLTLRNRHLSLDGDFQGWGSASCMLMARAFNQLGALHTHFVPFQNNLPLGRDPDVYLHWPPLYPLVLGWCLRVAGDTVFTGRLLAWAINVLSAGAVAALGRRLYTERVGWWAAFFFLTSRAVFIGNSALLQQPLAMLFALVALLCFLQRIPLHGDEGAAQPGTGLLTAVGLLSTALMVCTAWDPVFVPFGLLGTGLFLRERRAVRLAVAYCAAAVGAFLLVELDYIASYPKLFQNQFATIAYRAGLHFHPDTSMHLQTYVDAAVYEHQYGLIAGSWRALRFAVEYLSPLSLAAVVLFGALWWGQGGGQRDAPGQARPGTWLLGGTLVPALLWYLAMRNYVAIHPFPLILFVPVVAVASGWLLDHLLQSCRQGGLRSPAELALVTLVPLVLLLPLLITYRDAPPQPVQEYAALAAVIYTHTPPSAVVLTPSASLVPTLYSQRHLVRGITTDAWLAQAITQAHQGFPGAPLFLAVRDEEAGKLVLAAHSDGRVARFGDATLYRLP